MQVKVAYQLPLPGIHGTNPMVACFLTEYHCEMTFAILFTDMARLINRITLN
jgi:hypothetical protein